ncbi:hypothetical protein GCM10029964_061890 [Kibdelosporangium lantanae]
MDWQPQDSLAATRDLLRERSCRCIDLTHNRFVPGACQALVDAGLKLPDDTSLRYGLTVIQIMKGQG